MLMSPVVSLGSPQAPGDSTRSQGQGGRRGLSPHVPLHPTAKPRSTWSSPCALAPSQPCPHCGLVPSISARSPCHWTGGDRQDGWDQLWPRPHSSPVTLSPWDSSSPNQCCGSALLDNGAVI